MQFILMEYVNESGWPQLTKAEQEHCLGAYRSYMEAMTKAGVRKDKGPAVHLGSDDRAGTIKADSFTIPAQRLGSSLT